MLLGEEHLDTLSSVVNLADTYRSQGKYQQPVDWVAQALASRKGSLKEYFHTLESMVSLAITYDDQGKNHPQTLQSMAKLAITYQK